MVADDNPASEGVPFFLSKADVPHRAMPMEAGEFYVFHPKVLHASMVRPGVGDDATRCSIALRVATTATKILPAAFSRTPSRSGCVLLAGVDHPGTNKLATWPT
jgi:hypothetical protein